MKQLSEEAITKLLLDFEASNTTMKERSNFEYVWYIAQEAHKNALRRVMEWGNEECPHIADFHIKRQCGLCWQELNEQTMRL